MRGGHVSFVRVCCLGMGLLPGLALAGSNLVVNGSFDHPGDPLYGWKYRYDPEEDKNVGWYTNNHERVCVVPENDGRKQVLSLWGDTAILWAPGQGTKVDSAPIPFKAEGRFRFSAWVRSTGPYCRMMLEGYRWVPGIKPHPNPKMNELRRCYRFTPLYANEQQGGSRVPVGPHWRKMEMTLPPANPGKLQQEKLKEIEFVMVHIVAIDGTEGNLYVDDVRLEKLP